MKLRRTAVATFAALSFLLAAGPAFAGGQGVLAIVNDQPITTFDVTQRQKMMAAFGSPADKKKALQSLIDDVIKNSEAKKVGLQPTDQMVDEQIKIMGKGKPEAFLGRLKADGISANAVKRFIASQIAFQRLYRSKNPDKKIGADQAAVDREYKKIIDQYNKAVNDPRRRPVTVYSIQEILFPVEGGSDAGPLLEARAVEAQIFKKRYKGCKSARAAADGIFDVRVGKTIEADASKLPKQIRQALDSVGPGRAFGPARSQNGLQMIGFCSKRTITPPKAPPPPKRDQIERAYESKAFDAEEDVFMQDLRTKAIIDHKDASLSQ